MLLNHVYDIALVHGQCLQTQFYLNTKYLEAWKCRFQLCNLSLCPVAFLSQLLTYWCLLLSPSRQVTERIPSESNRAPQNSLASQYYPHRLEPTARLQPFMKNLPRLQPVVSVLVPPGQCGREPWESNSAQSRRLPPQACEAARAGTAGAQLRWRSLQHRDASGRPGSTTTLVLIWGQFLS